MSNIGIDERKFTNLKREEGLCMFLDNILLKFLYFLIFQLRTTMAIVGPAHIWVQPWLHKCEGHKHDLKVNRWSHTLVLLETPHDCMLMDIVSINLSVLLKSCLQLQIPLKYFLQLSFTFQHVMSTSKMTANLICLY